MSVFKPEDFRDAIHIGEMRSVLDRLAETANQILSERAKPGEYSTIEIADKITLVHAKLRAIAHLIEFQDSQQALPTDMDCVYWGLGTILNEIGKEMKTIA